MISATNTCSDENGNKKSSPPFYGKTKCVLYQNATHFDTKRIPFPYKTPPVLIQNATTASQESRDSGIMQGRLAKPTSNYLRVLAKFRLILAKIFLHLCTFYGENANK
jgi:hypothetical protein